MGIETVFISPFYYAQGMVNPCLNFLTGLQDKPRLEISNNEQGISNVEVEKGRVNLCHSVSKFIIE